MTKVQNALHWLHVPDDLTRSNALTGRRLAAYAITVGVCAYALLIGGPFAGITDPAARTRSMLLLTILGGVWWLERLIRRVSYRVSLIDGIALAWVAAIGIAWVANGLDNRRSGMGAWYDALALLVVLVIADLIRRGLPRRWIADGVLLAGGYAMVVACEQTWGWFTNWWNLKAVGMPFVPLRPPGTLGNPNSLATALIVLVMLALPRIWHPSRLILRIGWGLYILFAGGVLLLTESKGAWIGLIVGFVALGIFAWRASNVQISLRRAAKIAAVAAAVGGAIFILVGLPLLDAGARADGRLGIYAVALHAFAERPLTGHGPDSFSLQLMTNQSIPPQPPHAHAHDVPLHVAAELGFGGLVALAFTAIGGLWLYWRTLTRAAGSERYVLVGLGGACLAIAGHGIFDVTSSQPALFLLAAAMFGAAIADALLPPILSTAAPKTPALFPSHYRLENGIKASWFVLSAFVIVGGWWGTWVYADYADGIATALPGQYHQAAALLDTTTSVDPNSPVTWAAAGYIHGLAALVDKNALDLPLAIHAYERAVAIEPANAINWLNLAALYASAGQGENAIRAAAQAAQEAPDDPHFAINRGLILEQFGRASEAQAVYAAALQQSPELGSDPMWQQTNLRRAVAAKYPATPSQTEQILALLASGQINAAEKQIADEKAADKYFSGAFIDAALFDIRTSRNIERDVPVIIENLAAAAALNNPVGSNAWVHEALGELALARGDQPGHDQELAKAAEGDNRGVDGLTLDTSGTLSIATYFMSPLPRTLLPIVWYPTVAADLQRLMTESAPF